MSTFAKGVAPQREAVAALGPACGGADEEPVWKAVEAMHARYQALEKIFD